MAIAEPTLVQYLNYGAGTGLEPFLDGVLDEEKELFSVLNLVFLGVDLETIDTKLDDIIKCVCDEIKPVVNEIIKEIAFLKKANEDQVDLTKLIRLLISSVERTKKGRL